MDPNTRSDAIAQLREMFPIGSVVSVVLRHVTASGMSRSISVLHADPDGHVNDVSWLVARATGDKLDTKHGGIKVGGVGMDMGFHLVYGLARTLYRDFRCTGHDGHKRSPRCPSNDHVNDATPNFRRGRKHSDGGYALTHNWI